MVVPPGVTTSGEVVGVGRDGGRDDGCVAGGLFTWLVPLHDGSANAASAMPAKTVMYHFPPMIRFQNPFVPKV